MRNSSPDFQAGVAVIVLSNEPDYGARRNNKFWRFLVGKEAPTESAFDRRIAFHLDFPSCLNGFGEHLLDGFRGAEWAGSGGLFVFGVGIFNAGYPMTVGAANRSGLQPSSEWSNVDLGLRPRLVYGAPLALGYALTLTSRSSF